MKNNESIIFLSTSFYKNEEDSLTKNFYIIFKEVLKLLFLVLNLFIIALIFLMVFFNKEVKKYKIKEAEKKILKEEKENYNIEEIYTNRYIKENLSPSIITHIGEKRNESKKYIELCYNGELLDNNISNYKLSEHPKVTIVIAIYNKEKYIKSVLRSIQNQPLKDIEILFVNDCSIDNSVEIIKKYQKEDKRIRLIQNEVNSGVLYTRKIGVKDARGEYIFIMDGDDLLLEHGLNDAYKLASSKNLDMVEFTHIKATINNTIQEDKNNKYLYHKHNMSIILGNESKTIIFKSRKGKIDEFCFLLWRFLFKREIILKGFELLDKYYQNEKAINIWDDTALLYASVKYANSYVFIDVPGYFWSYNDKSITNSKEKTITKNNMKIKCYYHYIIFIYDYFDESQDGLWLKGEIFKRNTYWQKEIFYLFTEGFDELFRAFDIYINSKNLSYTVVECAKKFKEISQNTYEEYKKINKLQ